jgi:hypothetical protein
MIIFLRLFARKTDRDHRNAAVAEIVALSEQAVRKAKTDHPWTSTTIATAIGKKTDLSQDVDGNAEPSRPRPPLVAPYLVGDRPVRMSGSSARRISPRLSPPE